MAGLGLLGDAPAVAEQPPCVDGVHLRWSVPRDKAFPWHGFFLFRRPSQREFRQDCVGPRLKAGEDRAGATEAIIGGGAFSSDAPLVFTTVPGTGEAGLDLRLRPWLRFDLPPTRAVHRFRVTIAILPAREERRCIDFADLRELIRLPLERRGATLSAPGRRAAVTRAERDELKILSVDGMLDIALQEPADWVEIELPAGLEDVSLQALDASGARLRVKPRQEKEEDGKLRLRLAASGIARLKLARRDGLIAISRFCFGTGGGRERAIRVEGLDRRPGGYLADDALVASAMARGRPGETVSVELHADRMTGLRIGGGEAVLTDICWSEVAADAAKGWEPVPGCPQPLALPVRHPDYPAWTGPVDLPTAEAEGLGRVFYGPAADWAGGPFAELHDMAGALVQGGPAAGAMDAPGRASPPIAGTGAPGEPKTPSLPSLHPLDLMMLGAVHRPIAELLGLSWTDQAARPGERWDYLVVADHAGVSGGDPFRLLKHLANAGFDAGTDGWIVFRQEVAPRAPFTAPEDVVAQTLPGGPMRTSTGGLAMVAGSAGLTWPRAASSGWLDPGSAVAHHVYRGGAGAGTNPAMPAEATDWLTRKRPVLWSQPMTPPVTSPPRPPGWPPTDPAFLDLRLAEGWYAYQVVAVDIFGRFSPKSAFAAWWQWAPEPVPRPWYYQGSNAAAQLHPGAVRILSDMPPPAPLALEAYALDPKDQLLVQDAAYAAWRASLGAGGADLVGLRVRWRWSPEQQARAPNVTEFRLYWSPGSQQPANWGSAAAWPTRFALCPSGANVTVAADGTRLYEMFLPTPGGTIFAGGVPLAPSLADPIAYAQLSVTAADAAAHAADAWPGAGPLGNRPGREGGCAPPQRVFRVWREPPPPPQPVVDSDRVYATPADWHGRSRITVRWMQQPGLSAHVFRALDEAVFEADWAAQPRAALALTDPAFPDAAAEPLWTAARKTQVKAKLDAIRALLPAAPSAAQRLAAKPQGLALYRALPDDALRVLANRAGNERAFVQVTVAPLSAAAAPDRRGPDDAAGYVPSAARCASVDEVEGRATNRLLYRMRFLDPAQNRSPFGPCGTPVRLPDVVAPAAPSITRARSGERQVTLDWASNREPDLLEYRIFHAEDERAAADLRRMTLRGAVAADPDPANRPATVSWTDPDVPGLRDLWYRVVAVDRTDPDPRGGGGNVSLPSPAIRLRATDTTPPVPPVIAMARWMRADAAGNLHPYADPIPAGAQRDPVVELAWPAAEAGVRLLVLARPQSVGGFGPASGWLAPGSTGFIDRRARPIEPIEYRLKAVSQAGNANAVWNVVTVAPP
jgi:hypothetical protein